MPTRNEIYEMLVPFWGEETTKDFLTYLCDKSTRTPETLIKLYRKLIPPLNEDLAEMLLVFLHGDNQIIQTKK